MKSLFNRLLVVMVILGALPSLAAAQSLAGTVRDTSGAVLPGVTIEASSPALITKVRSGVTDDAGQYRIPDLPPGTYKVSFTLPGFATVVREGLELSGGGVMTIGAEMRVGGLEESITVTGESPVVDVQTARQQMTIDGDIVRALPASRSYGNYIAAIPAIQATGFGSGAATINNFFSARGGRNTEGLIQLDGMNVGAPGNGGGVSGYLYDMSNSSEVQVAISGGLGEADRGGPAFNIIPKTGGNTFSGTGFMSYAGEWGQSSNIDDYLRSLTPPFGEQPALIKSYDANLAVGGPILRDRVWFFANTRAIGTYQEQQNLYANQNAGDPNAWTWVKAETPSVRNSTSKTLNAVRLTWQATQKNKFGFYIDYTKNCSGGAYTEGGEQCRAPGDGWVASGPGVTPGTATVSPESGSIWDAPAKIMQASWTSPFSNRLLLETGYSAFYTDNGDPRPYGVLTDFIPVTEQSTGAGVPFANFIYRGFNPAPSSNQKHATWRGAMSYVSGSHNMKWGYQAGYMIEPEHDLRRPADQLPVQQRRPESAVAARGNEPDQQQPPLQRRLHPGPVDAPTADGSGCVAFRDGLELGAGWRERHYRRQRVRRPVPATAHRWCEGVPRHHAADGRGLRCLRQRQDGAQGERGAIPPGRMDRGCLHDQQRRVDARDLDQSLVVGSRTGIAWPNATS